MVRVCRLQLKSICLVCLIGHWYHKSIWLQMVRCRNGVFLCFFILLMFVEMWSINFLPLIFTFGSITWQGNSYVLRSICSYISQAAEQDVASKFASPVSIMELSQVLLKEDSTAWIFQLWGEWGGSSVSVRRPYFFGRFVTK